MAEMDDKIRELKAAVDDKDAELEKLKETVKMLQEKITSNGVKDKIANGDVKIIANGKYEDDIIEETVHNDNAEYEAVVADN